MRNKVFGGIGVVWGGGIMFSAAGRGLHTGNSAYQSGERLAVLFGMVMFAVGLFVLIREFTK